MVACILLELLAVLCLHQTGQKDKSTFLRLILDSITDDVSFLTEDDFKRGKVLTEAELYNKRSDHSKAWIQKENYFSDIRGKASRLSSGALQSAQPRNGVRLTYDKWPGGQIPYIISKRYTNWERAILARALQAYHDRTCLQFLPRTTERDYLYIGKIDGCFSDVGRAGGRQEVSLDDGCLEYDTAIHELMHAVGFWHEHERWDRDDYINILWQNIEKDAYDQFGKVNLFESDYYAEPYDYLSIMHYDSKAFSKNNQNTIETRQMGFTQIIGHVKDFSEVDLRKINKMYSCRSTSSSNQNNNNLALPINAAINSGAGLGAASVLLQQPQASVFPPVPSNPFAQPQQPFVQRPVTLRPATNSYQLNLIHNPFENLQPLQQFATPPPQQPQQPDYSGRRCKDKASLCWRWVSRCRSPFFDQIMREFCAATCGFCYATPGESSVDPWSIYNRENGKRR